MKGKRPNLVVDADAVDSVPRAPSWLSKHAKAEWQRVLPALVQRKILTVADLGSLENYCVACGRVRELERVIQAASDIDPVLFRLQDKATATARQLASELGLTPVSRSRPSVREGSGEDDSPNPLNLS